MFDKVGVIKVAPVPNEVPPEAALNQFIVLDETADNVTKPFPHLLAAVVLVIVGNGFIVATTAVRADAPQPAFSEAAK